MSGRLWLYAAVMLAGALLPSGVRAEPLEVMAQAVAMNRVTPEKITPLRSGEAIDGVEFRGAWALSSADPRFGGLSSIEWGKGDTLVAVADGGDVVTLSLGDKAMQALYALPSPEKDAGVMATMNGTIAPLLDKAGKKLSGLDMDSEGLVIDADGSYWISFERNHRIDRYDAKTLKPTGHIEIPADIRNTLPINGGFESIVRIDKNTMFALAEPSLGKRRKFTGWLFGKGAPAGIPYEGKGGFTPTDMTTLPNGDVLVLERRISPRGSRYCAVILLPRAAIRSDLPSGKTVKGTELFTVGGRNSGVEQVEGIAVKAIGKDAYQILLVSDDNYSESQRTVLMEWRYKAGKK